MKSFYEPFVHVLLVFNKHVNLCWSTALDLLCVWDHRSTSLHQSRTENQFILYLLLSRLLDGLPCFPHTVLLQCIWSLDFSSPTAHCFIYPVRTGQPWWSLERRTCCNHLEDSLTHCTIISIFNLSSTYWFPTKYPQNSNPVQPQQSVGRHGRVVRWVGSPGPWSSESPSLILHIALLPVPDSADGQAPPFICLDHWIIKRALKGFDRFKMLQLEAVGENTGSVNTKVIQAGVSHFSHGDIDMLS